MNANADASSRKSAKQLAPSVEETIVVPDENGNPAIYVVKFEEKGYFIISASIKEKPILGYSYEDVFDIDNMPLGLANWFYERMHKIQIINEDLEYEIPQEVTAQWSALGINNAISGNALTSSEASTNNLTITSTVLEEYGPLLTTEWGQGSPYSDHLEEITCDGGTTDVPPTGCVATAIAQVARYYSHGNAYNWSIMPTSRTIGRSTAGDSEVADLMSDIGSAVDMDYSCTESGASTQDAIGVFENLFGYSFGGTYNELSDEVAEQFVAIDILFFQRPVIMSGKHTYYTSTSGWGPWEKTTHHYENGHAWVCDGYRYVEFVITHPLNTMTVYSKYYHMNWGWNGSGMGSTNNNGWFLIGDLEVSGVNIKISKGLVNPNFQYKKGYITGIRP